MIQLTPLPARAFNGNNETKGYKRYLLKKLVKIKNGNHRQEQIRKWKREHPNTRESMTIPPKRTVAFLEDS
jgi:hypothetical protein